MRRCFSWRMWLPVCALAWGCSPDGNAIERPYLVPVCGVVTFRGEPVAGAHVTFFRPDTPRTASGVTDAQGRYRLTSFEPHDGAAPGEHAVTVFKPAVRASSRLVPWEAIRPAAQTGECTAPEQGDGAEADVTTPEQVRALLLKIQESQLPEKYAVRETSGLHAVVSIGGPNEIDFELTSDADEPQLP